MALWAKAQQLPHESIQKIKAIYGDHFPIEVRHYLAAWLEDTFWQDIEPLPNSPHYEQYVVTVVNNLIQEVENKSSTVSDTIVAKWKLAEAAKNFRERFSTNPIQLFNYIRECLATEMRLVQATNGDLPATALHSASNITEIITGLDALRNKTRESSEELRIIEQEQEAFALQYHDCTKKTAFLHQLSSADPTNHAAIQKLNLEKENMEQLLQGKVSRLVQLRIALVDRFKETHHMLHQVQTKVLDEELIKWKREQQLAGNGAIFNNNLDTIQGWCESLAEIIWANRQQIKEFEILKKKLNLEIPSMIDVLNQLLSDFTQLLSSLVTSTFVIEKQPPQVMKTNTRFTATVRLLVGGKLNVHMNPPQVKVTIISESQANILLKNDKLGKSGEASGEILNNTGTMEYQSANQQLSVSFRNMQLKKIKRAEKKGTESVMDEKFSLLFQSQFSVGGGELVFQVWTLSLPVVVIVHGNQEPHAWATVTWDNAFSDSGRVPFAVPDKVAWIRVAETLSLKFKAATGRSLTDEHVKFLADKALRGNYNNDPNQTLSWAQFCKEPLADRNFTFWEWFFAVMKLTREHLRGPWADGTIIGFITKNQAEEMLQAYTDGTFLLRYSDSELGGITIAWVSESSEVFMLQPFTSKDFGIRSLADRISDLNHLVNLYPNTPKDVAFNKYYTPYQENQSTTTNGYVKPLLVTHIPGWSGPGSFPNTPQHSSFIQSPDPSRDTPSVTSSYAGSVSTTMQGSHSGMEDYLSQFDECNIDINGLVNFSDLMQGYKQ